METGRLILDSSEAKFDKMMKRSLTRIKMKEFYV